MAKRFEVCTACHSRVLNSLYHEGVSLSRVRVSGRTLSFTVPSASCAQVVDVLSRHCFSYTVRDVGPLAVLAFLRRRKALWITAIVLCLALVTASSVVWTVRVDCPESLSAAVHQALSEAGALSPRFRAGLDLDALRYTLSGIDGVSLVSLSVRGVYLQVDVKAELPDATILAPSGALVASCDCVISRVIVEQGRALVQAGDSVRRGDVLIAPEYLLDPDADVTAPTRAVGTVYAYTYPSYSYQFDEHVLQTTRTGRCTRTATLTVLDRSFGAISPSPYAEYATETQVFTLGTFIPVTVARTTYYETQTDVVFTPFLSVKEEITEYCYAQILSQLKKGVHISRKWCIIDNKGSIYRVRAYAEVEQTVSIYADEE